MVDRYTKAVLTIIAVCLVLIVARDFAPRKAVAQMGQQHVVLDSVGTYAFQFATVPVRVQQ